MQTGKRLPLSQRLGLRPTPEPSEGVPAHLRRSLMEWFVGWSRSRDDIVKRIAHRLQVAYSPQRSVYGVVNEATSFIYAVDQSTDRDRLLLDAVDELLAFRDVLRALRGDTFDPEAWEQLDQVLDDGASVWRVGPTSEQLVRRVDDAVQHVVDQAFQQASPTAGQHLATAWSAVYGRRPDPDRGYDEAVLAVEATAIPVVSPQDPRPTLGKVIAHLKPTVANWQLAGGGSIDSVLGLMDQLWTGQPRHAIPGQPPRRIDQAEAEVAVHTAAYLVHLFSRGLIARR